MDRQVAAGVVLVTGYDGAIGSAVAARLGRPPGYAELQREFGRLIHGEPDWPTRAIPKAVAKTGAWLQDKAEDVVPDAIDQGEEPFVRPFMVELADDHFELDISQARSLLGWRPRHDLRATLPKMIEALQADRGAWYARHKLTSPAGVSPQQRRALDDDEAAALKTISRRGDSSSAWSRAASPRRGR